MTLLRSILRFALVCYFLGLTHSVLSQDRWYFQCIISQVEDAQTAFQLDSSLKVNSFVLVSRTDVNTRNYMAICSDQEGAEAMEDLLVDLGLNPSCVSSGLFGVTRIEPLDPRACDHNNSDPQKE